MRNRKRTHLARQAEERPPDFCDYGVGVLAERLEKMLAHTEGAASGKDTRAIHQMRVWSRRSRAALDVFGVCFTEEEPAFGSMAQEVKTVTRALGAARDLDVMLETLHNRLETLPLDQRRGVDSFREYLQAQRKDRQQAVTASVKHLEKRKLKQQLSQLAKKQGYQSVTVEMPPPPQQAALEPSVSEQPETREATDTANGGTA